MTYNLLHTEASPGWGGQELRILRESEGMRKRGHSVIFAVEKGGGLVSQARQSGFTVYELSFKKKDALRTLWELFKIIRKHKIDIINTHSSMDAWLGGIAARIYRKSLVRTRHLSTPIRAGLNSLLLYNFLADFVVTTCRETALTLQKQAKLKAEKCISIPTGVNSESLQIKAEEVKAFKEKFGIQAHELIVGTLCVLRGWKGVSDLLGAASLLKEAPIKWLIVGGGVSEEYFKQQWREQGLEKNVIFTGHIDPPFVALAAMDIFVLLSWANEGVSQASLQAAYLEKPLITTPTGGLKEVCLNGITGIEVPVKDPEEVATAVLKLAASKAERERMGQEAKQLVLEKFTFEKMLDQMEAVYKVIR